MKIKIFKSIIITFLLFSCNTKQEKSTFNNFKEYVPQVFNGDRLIESPKMLTPTHQKNIINILDYYNEDWKIENDKLLVNKNISNEILWNYTTKANDSIWIHKHLAK